MYHKQTFKADATLTLELAPSMLNDEFLHAITDCLNEHYQPIQAETFALVASHTKKVIYKCRIDYVSDEKSINEIMKQFFDNLSGKQPPSELNDTTYPIIFNYLKQYPLTIQLWSIEAHPIKTSLIETNLDGYYSPNEQMIQYKIETVHTEPITAKRMTDIFDEQVFDHTIESANRLKNRLLYHYVAYLGAEQTLEQLDNVSTKRYKQLYQTYFEGLEDYPNETDLKESGFYEYLTDELNLLIPIREVCDG